MKEETARRLEALELAERERRRNRWEPVRAVWAWRRSILVVAIVALALWFLPQLLTPDLATSAFFFVLLVPIAALYLVPFIVAASRKHPATDAILVVNLFLGWTFLGWVLALAWACSRPAPGK